MTLSDFHIPRWLRPALAQAARVVCSRDLDELGLTGDVVDHFELQLRAFPAGFRTGMVAGLAALEAGAALRPRSFGRRFSQLGLDEARDWFATFWHSPFGVPRQFARAVKALCALVFYDRPEMRERLEYHPDAWIAQVARQRLERWGLEIGRHEEELVARDPLLPQSHLVRRVRHA